MINLNLKNAKILIVDDQQANIDVLTSLLRLQGYENVKDISDSRNFEGIFKEYNPDLILLDLSMPYLSGFDILEQLKLFIPGNTFLPVLILTADVTPQAKQRALSSGAHDFLTKPFDLIEVGLRIKNLLFARSLQQQLQNQNIILEEKVKERTDDLVRTNLELTASRDKAEASDRLKTAFIQNISHEIRTPLNGILGFGSLLTEDDLSPEEKLSYFELMRKSGNRLTQTITDFMDISLIVSNNMEINVNSVDIIRLLDNIKEQNEKSAELKNLELKLLVSDDQENIVIHTDPELLTKILQHIIDNAIKFTEQGRITIGFSLKSATVEFCITDTGTGIEESAQVRIFDSFEQENMSSTRNYEGSGLGLSISKKLVELLGGKIWLNSVKHEGTSVYFSIPVGGVKDKQIEDLTKRVATTQEDPFKSYTVLIAEDDEVSGVFLKKIMEKYCDKVLSVTSGFEAVKVFKENPDIDLILMDIKMPGMDGYEATQKIRAYNKDVIIIAQTAYALKGDKEKALNAGFNEYSTKPINITHFNELMKKYLSNK